MIPESLEYGFLLVVYLAILLLLFQETLLRVLRRGSFWLSYLFFALSWTLIERYGLAADMWRYSKEKLLNIEPLGVPLEEHIVFFLIHLATILSWERCGRHATVD